MNDAKKICIIGGGAAGMMAAGTAVLYGADVTVFEGSGKLGKKLAITGKGRCNVTNNCTVNEFLDNVISNPRFLYASFAAFDSQSTIDHFEGLGVKLKTERGRRVFPESDRAFDIVDAMKKYSSGAKIVFSKVTKIFAVDSGFKVIADKEYFFDACIIATGGRSYPLTGSDGSGYRIARELGHTITAIKPSLVPIESPSVICKRLQGLSLKNVAVSITSAEGKVVYNDFGEMMFTHFGVTGPMILSASAHIRGYDIKDLTLNIDLKPALDEKELDNRLLSDFKKMNNKDFVNSLGALLPSKMIEPFVDLVGIDPHKKVNEITKEERKIILSSLKKLSIPLSGFRPIEEAIVTSGGVDTKEITPKTLESKIHPGLYFAGEVIDVDAYTGGYNLQIAFSTGFLAGKSAAEM